MKPTHESPPDRTEELEALLQAKIGKGPEAYPKKDWVSLREGFRIALLYPNQYVAFRDHHQGKGRARRLASREVVYVSAELAEVRRYVDGLPDERMQGLVIEFVPGEPKRRRGRKRSRNGPVC